MSELDLIARIRWRLGPPRDRLLVGIGDDAAITRPGAAAATTVDAVVDGVHFDRAWASPAEIGGKALAAAASDLAAMGAEPGEAYVTVGLPGDLGEDGCEELIEGLVEAADQRRLQLAGGDIVRADRLFLALTAVGYADRPESLLTRGGARPGEIVALTGEIGGAAAGLELLREPSPGREPAAAAELRARQIRPPARLEAGRALADSGATAMIDLSDGLGADAGHLASESGVRIRIDLAAAPIAPGLDELAAARGLDPDYLASGEGEDYELLAALPADRLEGAVEAVRSAGAELTAVGEVTEGSGVELRGRSGRALRPRGFDQLDR